jgi:hypothetical protein
VQPLQAAVDLPLMGEFRALVDAMMPRLDLPDLLMEVAARTGFTKAFTHYSGAGSALEGFASSVSALLVAEVGSCRTRVVSLWRLVTRPLTAPHLGRVAWREQNVSEQAGQWHFLTNHARALFAIARDPAARLRDIAAVPASPNAPRRASSPTSNRSATSAQTRSEEAKWRTKYHGLLGGEAFG